MDQPPSLLTGTSQVQSVGYTYGDATHPGDVTATTDPTGKVWTYAWDTHGNRVSEADPLGNSTTHTWDTLGRRLTTVSPRGNLTGANPADHRTTFAYDAASAVTSVTDPLGHVTAYVYDAAGNRTRVTDPDNHVTDSTYDLAGQLTSVTRPDTTTLVYGHDADGNRTSERDAANHTTTYAYDALDRVASTTDPLNRTTTVGYDAAGNRTSVTDPAGQVTSFGYDAGDRLTSVSYSDGVTPGVAYTYDNLGRRLTMADGTGTTSYSWDSLSRLASSTNGAGATVGHGWDLSGRPTSLAYPGGSTVTRAYDDAGRLTSVTDWLTNTTTFAYDADSNPTGRTLPNGTAQTDVFDRADRLTSIDHKAGATTFASFSYGRSNAGLLTSTTPTGTPQSNEAYTYSSLDQLKTVNGGTYSYDAADNPTGLPSGAAQAFDAANQLTSSTLSGATTTFGFDSRGNRTSVTPPTGSATTLGWDQANRLTAYGASAIYAYDGDGLRSSKTVSGTTRAFTWDTGGGLPLLLRDGADAYVYGPDGTPIERIAADGTVTWVHADQLGSVRALTDSTGAVVGTFAFDAYGTPTGSTGTVSLPFGFAGEYRDAESGLVYLRARYYDPATAQFVSRDPITAVTGSPYGYTSGNPLNAVHPRGLAATFAHYGAEARPPGMSNDDYRAYLRVVDGMNQQSCEGMRAYREGQARREKEQALEARIAAMVEAMHAADRARAAVPNVWWEAVTHPKFSVQVFVQAVVDVVQCYEGAVVAAPAGGAVGGAAGGAVGSVGGSAGAAAGATIGGAVGAAAGAIAGCAAGVANAHVNSPRIG